MVACPMMPLGPASVGTGEGSVFFTAARVAEAAGRAQAEGKKRRCSRNSRDVITPEECLAKFRAGLRPCVTPPEEMGRCTTGQIEDAKHPEDTMGSIYGRCANPDCQNHHKRMSLPAKGLCGVCYRKVLAGTMVWPPEKERQVEPETAGAPVEAKGSRPSEGVQDQPQASPAPQDVTCYEETAERLAHAANPEGVPARAENVRIVRPDAATLEEAAGQDHIPLAGEMVPDLPEDLDRPFVLAGIEFAPLHKRRQSGENYVALRTTSLGISTAAEAELGLKRYTHARYTVSLDGTAVAIKFLTEKKPGALCVNRSTGSMAISAQPLASKHPELVGKKARLEATDVRDWFVVRFGGEAAVISPEAGARQ